MPGTIAFPLTRQGVRDLDRPPRNLPRKNPQSTREAHVNPGPTRRLVFSGCGAAIALFGLSRGTLAGIGMALVGGALVCYGIAGAKGAKCFAGQGNEV